MDKIEKFEIELDISDREVIYDYVAKEEIHRPHSGVWDPKVFKGKGTLKQIPVNDEDERMRISLMDRCFMDTNLLERKVKAEKKGKEKKKKDDEEGEKEEDIGVRAFETDPREPADTMRGAISTDDLIFSSPEDAVTHLPRRLIPIYHPGDEVKGHLILKLKEPIQAESLKLKFVGQTAVNVRIYNKYGYSDDTQYEKFTDESRVLWEKTDDGGRAETSDKYTLLTTSESPAAEGEELEAGEHKFFFEFVLPADAPQSVPPVVISTVNFAHLVWRLKAKIEMGSFLKYGNIATHRGIWVEKEVDVANFPSSKEEVTIEETLDTGLMQFWKTGKLMCRATIPQSGHVKGNTVHLKLEVDNQTKGEISKVQARIRLQGKARLHDSKLSFSNKINIKSEKISEGPVGPGMNPTYNWDLVWDFTDSSADGRLLPVGVLEESKLIEIKYDVVVKLSRKGLHRNMELSIPLKVGNCDSSVTRSLLEDFSTESPEVSEVLEGAEGIELPDRLEAPAERPASESPLFPPLNEFA